MRSASHASWYVISAQMTGFRSPETHDTVHVWAGGQIHLAHFCLVMERNERGGGRIMEEYMTEYIGQWPLAYTLLHYLCDFSHSDSLELYPVVAKLVKAVTFRNELLP